MPARKPKVIVTRRLPDPVETRMRELFDTELNLDDTPMDREALLKAVQRADAIVPTITDQIDADLIAAAGDQLKLIANFGAGVDHIDVAAANERGIAVTNTPGVLTEDTADLTMALIMAVSRRIVEGANVVQAGEFTGWTPTWMMGRRVNGKRLGILGMGRIGQAVARYVSLKFDKVYARAGPGEDHKLLWVYQAKGLPVQVIAENSEWRRICDPDGGMAWVHRRLTSGESTVMRAKPTRLGLHKKPRAEAEIVAYLNPRAIAELVKGCENGWCRVRSDGVSGWAQAGELWGTSDAIQCKVARPGAARSR